MSGGWEWWARDWLRDGCAAAAEPDSRCGSNDARCIRDVTYDHEPAIILCPKGGEYRFVKEVDYDADPGDDTYHYKRRICGSERTI